jgi:hypothetical protein
MKELYRNPITGQRAGGGITGAFLGIFLSMSAISNKFLTYKSIEKYIAK